MHDVVLTCYLTERPDPQRRGTWKSDDDTVVKTWISSLTHCNLRGIIFHDSLSEAFCERWASLSVTFQQIRWRTPWTAAEERARICADWLRENCSCRKVLTTDLSDVEFYRNPFPLMTVEDVIYIGSEPIHIGKSSWLMRRMRDTYGEVTDADKFILNPGILGGSRDAMATFLALWLDEMQRAIQPTLPPHDIVAFNRIIYRRNIPYVTGYPLHTKFKHFENATAGCAIRHK